MALLMFDEQCKHSPLPIILACHLPHPFYKWFSFLKLGIKSLNPLRNFLKVAHKKPGVVMVTGQNKCFLREGEYI